MENTNRSLGQLFNLSFGYRRLKRFILDFHYAHGSKNEIWHKITKFLAKNRQQLAYFSYFCIRK